MGRGKIEIKKIENSTNRQVTFAKRRAGLIKKAQELTVLCDAEILLILLSASGNRGFHYCSPSTNIKEMIDRFQEAANVDLWSEPYEKMQRELEDLTRTNSNLRKEIRQRMGEELDELDSDEVRALAEDLEFTARVVREEKYNELRTKTNTKTKKVKKFESELEGTLFYARSGPKEAQELGYVFDGQQEELFRTAAAATVGYGNEAAAVGTFGGGAAEEAAMSVGSGHEYYRPTSSAFGFTGIGEEVAYNRLQPSQSKDKVEYAGLHELRLA